MNNSGPKVLPSEAFGRALRLKCPRCGGSRLFATWLKMAPRCDNCGLNFQPEAGYYLGATYINYGLTAGILMVSYMSLRFGAGFESRALLAPLITFCVLFPLLCFRHSRALWLAFDILLDRPDDPNEASGG